MATVITLKPDDLKEIRQIDSRMMSYNVEMTEITGGTFWKAYTPEQIAGTEEFPKFDVGADTTASLDMMQVYPPINLYDERLLKLVKELGTAWVRVSGTWATKTYYDFDGKTNGVVPEGFQSILTKEQWIGVLDFVKAINGKLLLSVANCEGIHSAHEPWNPKQAELIFKFSKEYGVPIDAVEFMNEPNMMEMSGSPAGYTPADYARDQDIFFAWVRNNYPGTLLVGPCTTGELSAGADTEDGPSAGGGIADVLGACSTDALLEGTKERPDIFSYHYYNGISERLAGAMPSAHWPVDKAHTEPYLAVAPNLAKIHAPLRDKYCPGGQMWVTESGDAGGGGNTWASTYLDVLRTLNELGSFSTITDGVIFHNTLASSDYGFLQHGTFEPRPNYFAALLWNRLMGQTVYDSQEEVREGAHVYVHSRKDSKEGVVYLIINNSKTETTTVNLSKKAECYTLSGENLRATTMMLNGKPLVLGEYDEMPEMKPVVIEDRIIELAPGTCTFLVM